MCKLFLKHLTYINSQIWTFYLELKGWHMANVNGRHHISQQIIIVCIIASATYRATKKITGMFKCD